MEWCFARHGGESLTWLKTMNKWVSEVRTAAKHLNLIWEQNIEMLLLDLSWTCQWTDESWWVVLFYCKTSVLDCTHPSPHSRIWSYLNIYSFRKAGSPYTVQAHMGRELSELVTRHILFEISHWFLCRIGYKLKEWLFWDHSLSYSDWNVSFLFVFHAFGSSLLPQAHSASCISHVAGIQIHQDIIDIATSVSSLLLRAGGLRSCDKAELSSSCVFVCTDLFSLFASDLGGYAAREDIEAVLQVLDGEVPASLKEFFGEVSKRCKDCTALIC